MRRSDEHDPDRTTYGTWTAQYLGRIRIELDRPYAYLEHHLLLPDTGAAWALTNGTTRNVAIAHTASLELPTRLRHFHGRRVPVQAPRDTVAAGRPGAGTPGVVTPSRDVTRPLWSMIAGGGCFSSGPPQGLCKGMLGPLDQLQAICAGRRLMIGFDRGGSYPKTFSELRDRGLDWVTYRRAPLLAPAVKPRLSWVTVDGRRHYVRVADERVELDGYGQCLGSFRCMSMAAFALGRS